MSSGAGHMIRYAIYTRQSVDKAEDFSSCEAQFMTCQDFARETGEPWLHWIGERFGDEGRFSLPPAWPANRHPILS